MYIPLSDAGAAETICEIGFIIPATDGTITAVTDTRFSV